MVGMLGRACTQKSSAAANEEPKGGSRSAANYPVPLEEQSALVCVCAQMFHATA